MMLAALATPLALCVELDAAAEGHVQPVLKDKDKGSEHILVQMR